MQSSLLDEAPNRESLLVHMLNSDASLDLHVLEAVKLHMLVSAMQLHSASATSCDLPLFAILMFARDTSETPRDLMNNHLQAVGNTGGLEQVIFPPELLNFPIVNKRTVCVPFAQTSSQDREKVSLTEMVPPPHVSNYYFTQLKLIY